MIKVGPALMDHAEQLERERGIPKDLLLSSLKEAMVAAYKRYAKIQEAQGIICKIIEKTGEIGIYETKTVVNKVDPESEDPQIDLKDAQKLKADVELGEVIENEVTPDEFGRIAAQSAKQVITQRIREAEKLLIQKEFEEKQGMVTTAIIQRIEGRNVMVSIGKTEAVLPPKEQLPGEYYRIGNKLRVYVADLRDVGRLPQIVVSQSHPAMVREVFELEVPEIEDGLVEIKNIAREAGHRTKVAVHSHDPDVDPQGACIGTRGSRIQAIVNELKNEKIDIIRWSEDPVAYITNALAPAKIIRVEVNEENERQPQALVVVPDDQLSLAIGRDGQNVRLAARLTGYKVDIKSQNQLKDLESPPPEDQTEPVDAEEILESEEVLSEESDLESAPVEETQSVEESEEGLDEEAPAEVETDTALGEAEEQETQEQLEPSEAEFSEPEVASVEASQEPVAALAESEEDPKEL